MVWTIVYILIWFYLSAQVNDLQNAYYKDRIKFTNENTQRLTENKNLYSFIQVLQNDVEALNKRPRRRKPKKRSPRKR
jgi:hypothetical protein